MTPPATMIVIVAGSEYSIPIGTDIESVRTQLVGMGFTDVASATIQRGTKVIGDVTYETVEFVKKAGTKGLDNIALVAILARVPHAPVIAGATLTLAQHTLLWQIAEHTLTIGEVVARFDHDIYEALRLGAELNGEYRQGQGVRTCVICDSIPVVAARVPCAW